MTPEQQRIAIAEIIFDALVERDGMTRVQHPPGTEGYRGINLSGWWIYRRSDGTEYGTNWPTADECRHGNIAERANRNNYPTDANAALEFAVVLRSLGWECTCAMITTQPIWSCRFHKKGARGTYAVSDSLAAAICEAGLRALGKWVEP